MDRLNIALLKFNGKPYLKTELHCTGKFTPRNFPPFIFSIASEPGIQDGTKEITKVYRYFKDDLRLTEPQARNQDLAIEAMSDEDDAGDAGWSMLKSDVNPRPKDTEQIPADGSEVVYFSPMHASGFFIANLCAEAIQRVRDLFGEEEEIHIRFTAPNYEFEGDKSGAGQVLSQNYRDNIRSLIDEFIGHEKYPNVQFRLKGSDFVYEPYAAYHYFSKVEHAIDVRKEERGTTYLVFDMGGSTTDVAIVQVAGEEKQVFTAYPVSQSVRRAGEYYDRCILKHLLGRQQVTKRGEPKWTDVLDQIEQAKIRLCEGETDVEKVSIEIDGTIEKKVIDREVLRNVLTDVWERGASNQRIGRRLRGFLNRARKQVREHNFQVEFDQIDRVFLAGGSSSLPGIEQLIQQELASVGLWSGDTETNVEDASDVASAGEEDSSAWFHRFVNPKWKFFNGQDISKSVVVAAGRAAALSSKLGGDEPNDGRHDVEGQSVYVRVVDDEGEEYIFERKDERIAEKDGEFLLCDSSEIPLDGALSIGDGEQIEFKDCKLDSGAAAPPMLKVYLRSDVRDFPEEPQIRYTGKFTGDEDEDAWLRLDGKVKQKQAHLRVKPLIRYWQPAYDTRTQMNQDPQGHVTVRMDRPPELKGIHICIDFGMSNTAVAVYAPGLEMPVGDPSVEVLALPSWQESLSEQIASLLPSPPITLEKALSGIENIHRHFGYRRDLDGIAAFLRGTYLLAHYIERSKSTDKTDPLSAFKDISRTLKERGGPDLSPPELSDEAIATQDLLKFDSQLPQALAEHGIGVNLETIEERLTAFFEGQQEGEAPERQERLLPDGDEMENPSDDALNGKEETDAGEDDAETLGHGGDEESAPVGANGAESGTAHEAVQPEKTGAEDSGDKEAQQDDETKQVKEDQQEESEPTPNEDTSTADITMPTPSGSQPSSNGTASSDNHWTFGMAQWMEGLVDQVSNPLIRQNAQTQSAIKETQELVERTGKTLAELAQGVEAALDELKDGAQLTLPEEAKATLDSIDKSLKTLVNRVPKADEDEEDEDNPSVYSARDAKNRAFDKVEDKKHPVFYFAKEDKSLTDFEDFVEGEGFFYPPSIYRKVWGHLHTENTRLIILAGAPGAGKSTLARLLAEFFNADVDVETFEDEKPGWQAFWHMEAVSPSWFSPESLLGGKGPINGIVQPSAFSEFLMSAEAHHAKAELTEKPSRMFFGCLDEFNIARPEQYMASLLSKLEAPITTGGGSQRTIRFSEGKHGVSIELTPNLKLFATINTDAASKVLSPKVLDRAFFIRMTPTLENLKTVATKLKKKHLVSEFHDVFTKVLPDLDQLARAGQSPLGYRAMAKSYQYASSLKDSDVEVKTVVCDAVESVFLSKLPGAFSVNDPKQNYIGHLKDETSSLRTVIDVSSTLDVIANGLPGQASI